METVMCLSWPPVIESLKTHVSTKWKHGLSVYGYYFWYVWNVGFPLIRIQYTLVPGEGEHVVINTGSWGVPAQQSPLGCNVQCSELHWHVHSCEEQRITDRQFEISSAKVIGSSLIFTFFFSLFPVQTIFAANLKIEHLGSSELICCDYLAGEDHNFLN